MRRLQFAVNPYRFKERPARAHPDFVPAGRFMVCVADSETGELSFVVGGPLGEFAGMSPRREDAWYFNFVPTDVQAAHLHAHVCPSEKEVLMLCDTEHEDFYEFRGYGFRLVQGEEGGSDHE